MSPVKAEDPYGIDSPIAFQIRTREEQIDWESLFGNDHPVEIEIGCGKGRFIIASAMAYPDINYVGIEWALEYFRIMNKRIIKRGLTNIRILRDDAADLVRRFIPDESITAYHIYFPDPWPKRRHNKRRLIKPAFIRHVERTLRLGGTLDLATDHEEYYTEATGFLEASDILKRTEDLPERVCELGDIRTNYEVKYTVEGREIYRATFKKD